MVPLKCNRTPLPLNYMHTRSQMLDASLLVCTYVLEGLLIQRNLDNHVHTIESKIEYLYIGLAQRLKYYMQVE